MPEFPASIRSTTLHNLTDTFCHRKHPQRGILGFMCKWSRNNSHFGRNHIRSDGWIDDDVSSFSYCL